MYKTLPSCWGLRVSAHGGVFSSAESTKVDVGDEHDKIEAGQLSISLFIFLPFYYSP